MDDNQNSFTPQRFSAKASAEEAYEYSVTLHHFFIDLRQTYDLGQINQRKKSTKLEILI